jgi:hypothetical protein
MATLATVIGDSLETYPGQATAQPVRQRAIQLQINLLTGGGLAFLKFQ